MRMDIEQSGQRFDLPPMTKFGESSSNSSNGLTNGLHNSLTDHNDHSMITNSGASQQSNEIKMPFDPNQVRHRALAAATDVSKLSLVQREKRCRNYERETNELRDTICSMQHQIHLLANIKRVSRDYIRSMHELLRVTLSQECNEIEQLQLEVRELENELQHWERKHNLISAYQQTMQNTSPNAGSSTAGHNNHSWTEAHDLSGHTAGVNNHNDSEDSPHQLQHHHVRRSQSSILSTASQDAPPLLPNPSELCEMSLEAMLDDSMEYQNETNEQTRAAAAVAAIMNPVHSATSSPVIAAALAAASAVTNQDQFGLTSSQINLGQQANSGNKTMYHCDEEGCSFATPLRQRLSMHKKVHNGEILYSCDVPGCDYQSNYKGNIKIHKKHKHKNLDLTSANEGQAESESPGFERWVNVNGVFSGEFNGANRKSRKRKSAIYGQIEEEALDHSGNESRDAEGSFECQMQGCNYRTKWKHCLTAHQFAHTGVKPFACDFPGCNYRTNYKNAVKVHQRVHQRGAMLPQFEGQPAANSASSLNEVIIKEEPLSLGAEETEEDEEEEMDEAKEDSEEEVSCHLVQMHNSINGGSNGSFGSPIGPITS